ncbi:DUF2628 domain-containing protein [Lonepinella sp. MS14437]|uniref:DUF2628 domain-containing protein n=1 Tax=Lonepinella sp. MS14437 TaxID=3003620 RepID=UPI0036DC4B3A
MKQFKIYENEYTKEICLIPQGFTWLGFFFPFIWSLLKKHYLLAISVLGISFIGGLIVEYLLVNITYSQELGLFGFLLVNLGVSIFVGMNGNNLLEKLYANKGYSLKETVLAANQAHAIATYISNKNK